MNISLDNVAQVNFNNSEIAKVYFNSTKVWEKPVAQGIYGITWNKTNSSPILTRTDDAANFYNPVVSVGGSAGSSPFDNIMPWKGMVKEEIDGSVMVKIPKFWYNITENSNAALTLKIANYPATGFSVSPAHMDRGDGRGERDYVYIGRYKCSSVDLKSVSGVAPKVNGSLSTFRTLCSQVGTNYHLEDFTMYWTVRMLFLVEFATWNSQAVIGGSGGNGTVYNTGLTDTIPYHTGTIANEITLNTCGIQYRWIEQPWGNIGESIDGIIALTSQFKIDYVFSRYNNLGNNYPITLTRPTATNEIKNFSNNGWALAPSAVYADNSYSTYVCDKYGYTNQVCQLITGSTANDASEGLFHWDTYSKTTNVSGYVGCRLMYVP